MPIRLAVNDVVEFKIYCQNQGQYSVNTRHYRVKTVAGEGGTDLQATNAFNSQVQGPMKAVLSANATFLGVSGQIIKNIRRPKVLNLLNTGAGTYAGESLPRQVAGLISFATEWAGRAGRGRMYVPFPSEAANLTTGFPAPVYTDLVDNLRIALLSEVVADGDPDISTLEPIIYNRASNGRLPIVDGKVRQMWATQRRRSDISGGDKAPF